MRVEESEEARSHLDVAGASLDNGACVCDTSSLHLEVGEALELVVGECIGSLRAREKDASTSELSRSH